MDLDFLHKKIPEKKGVKKTSCIEAERFIEHYKNIPESKIENYFISFFEFDFSNFVDDFFDEILKTDLKNKFLCKKFILFLCAIKKIYAKEKLLHKFFEEKIEKNNACEYEICIANSFIGFNSKKYEAYLLITYIESTQLKYLSEKKLQNTILQVKNYFILEKTAEHVLENYAKNDFYARVFSIMREINHDSIPCINYAKFNFIMRSKKLPQKNFMPQNLKIKNSENFLTELNNFHTKNTSIDNDLKLQIMEYTLSENLDPYFILKYLQAYDCDETYCIILKNMKKFFNHEIYAKYFKQIIKNYLIENKYEKVSAVKNLNLRTAFFLLLSEKQECIKNINLHNQENYAILKKNKKFLIFYIFENFQNLNDLKFLCEKYEITKLMIRSLIKAIILLRINGDKQLMHDYTDRLRELTDEKDIFDFLCNYAKN